MDVKLICDNCGELHHDGHPTEDMINDGCKECGSIVFTERDWANYQRIVEHFTREARKIAWWNRIFFWQKRQDVVRVARLQGNHVWLDTVPE